MTLDMNRTRPPAPARLLVIADSVVDAMLHTEALRSGSFLTNAAFDAAASLRAGLERLASDRFDGVVVRRHGGTIWASSRLGTGTAVAFTIPVLDDTERAHDSPDQRRTARRLGKKMPIAPQGTRSGHR